MIFTGPVNVLEKVADGDLIAIEDSGHEVEYLGVMCMALVTKRPLTDFYILNIADDRIPFTAARPVSCLSTTPIPPPSRWER